MAAHGHEVVLIDDDGSREAPAQQQVCMAARGLASLAGQRHLLPSVCVCARPLTPRAGVARQQRPAASHDTESDDDADDFQAPGGVLRAAVKAPAAGAGLLPGLKSGTKRQGKENRNGPGGDSDDDSDFKAPAKKARGKKEAAKGQQRGISSFFSKGGAGAAPSAAAKARVPISNEDGSGGAGGASKAKQDLQLSDKGVIPHYIASQLQAHQVSSTSRVPFLCRRFCGVLLRFCALLGNTHASRRCTAFSLCGSTLAPSRRKRSAGASLLTPWAWARVCR